MQCSDLDSKLGSIQVAELTIKSKGAIPGQEVRISNDAYTIIANFNVALTVTVPIYCWGKYTVTSGELITTTITIDNSKFYYEIGMYDDLYIYNNGNEYNDLTAGWVSAFYSGNPDYTRLATAKTDSYLHIYDQDRGYNRYRTVWQTATSIDLTYCTKIIITCELVLSARVSGNAYVRVLLSPIISNGGEVFPTGTINAGTYSKPTDGNVTLEFDISEITGKYQIMIEGCSLNYSGNGPSNCNCKIKQVQIRK